jgi:hypothetical protein
MPCCGQAITNAKQQIKIQQCLDDKTRDLNQSNRHMRPRLTKAPFCCSVAQFENLDLKPWECPPCESEPDLSDNAGYAEQKRRAQ